MGSFDVGFPLPVPDGGGGANLFPSPLTGQQTFSTPGTYTFKVPYGVTRIFAACYGGGRGGSGAYDGSAGANGAGAGAATLGYLGVSPFEEVTITVGVGGAAGAFQGLGGVGGDSIVANKKGGFVRAKGGGAVATNIGAEAETVTGNVLTSWPGGNGGSPSGAYSGGGGGGASIVGQGYNGVGTVGGNGGPASGQFPMAGKGGDCTGMASVTAASAPGGGGAGGTGGGSGAGSAGGNGRVMIWW